MLRWRAAVALGLAWIAPAGVRADPPVTIVYFDTPRAEPPQAGEHSRTEPAPNEPASTRDESERPNRAAERASTEPPRVCGRPIVLVRVRDGGRERATVRMLDCEGRPRADALRAVSVLARDPDVDRSEAQPVHPALIERLHAIGERFPGHAIEIVAGHRAAAPTSSRHRHGRALDLRIAGIAREAIRDAAISLPQTGVGFERGRSYVHVDVRARSAYWTDRRRRNAVQSALEALRHGVRAPATPIERAPEDPSREELDALRRATDDALRDIRVPAPSRPRLP